jgi:hypothetical protein
MSPLDRPCFLSRVAAALSNSVVNLPARLERKRYPLRPKKRTNNPIPDHVGPAVIYRDSVGHWDRLRLRSSFMEFYLLNETNPEWAAARLLYPLP